jgi:hypothetical protein
MLNAASSRTTELYRQKALGILYAEESLANMIASARE